MLPTDDTLAEAAARLEAMAPGYLDRVRRQAAALGRPATEVDRARQAIATTVERAPVSVIPPLVSRKRFGRAVKHAISVAVRFNLLHVAAQVTDLAEASAWMGQAVLDYAVSLETEVADLRERVRRLEERLGAP